MHFGVSSDVGNNGVDHAESSTQGRDSHPEGPGGEACEAHSLPKAQVNTMLGEMVEDLGKHLKKGARIRISGLGILQVRKRPARMGRNPAMARPSRSRPARRLPSGLQGPQGTGDVGGDTNRHVVGPALAGPLFWDPASRF